MLAFLAQIFGGPIVNGLLDAYRARLASDDSAGARAVDLAKKEIDAALLARQQATQIRLATAGFWEMRLLTFLIALPFVIHVLLVGLDTNFKTGIGVYAFPKPFDEWEGAILMSFFGLQAGVVGVKAIAAGMLGRVK